jgi:hypothetical protein
MRPRGRTARMVCCLIAAIVMLLAAAAANSFASTSVRFLHAVPGAPRAQLTAAGTPVGSAVGFGEATEAVQVDAGTARLELTSRGGDSLARGRTRFRDGARYTVIALTEGGRTGFAVYRDANARGGRARFRAINASPELGEPDVLLSDRTIGERLAYKEATGYMPVRPGNYDVAFARPGGGDPVAERAGVNLAAGTATTGVVVGSRGEQARVVVLSDGTVAPSAAPDTGLGGLADGIGPASWQVVLAAALAAGLLGLSAFAVVRRRRRRRFSGEPGLWLPEQVLPEEPAHDDPPEHPYRPATEGVPERTRATAPPAAAPAAAGTPSSEISHVKAPAPVTSGHATPATEVNGAAPRARGEPGRLPLPGSALAAGLLGVTVLAAMGRRRRRAG